MYKLASKSASLTVIREEADENSRMAGMLLFYIQQNNYFSKK
jgi:hypothetical protein